MKRLGILLFLFPVSFLLCVLSAEDSGMGIEAGASMKVTKGLEASVDAEVRTQDGLSEMERWSIGASLDYKFCKWLKADAGYALIMRNIPDYSTRKYDYKQYWSPRQRAFVSLTGSYKLSGHLELSLRERYQFTFEPGDNLERYYIGTTTRASDKVTADDKEHLLRSRLQLEWGRKKCAWAPYISVEALNSLQDSFSLDQMRYTIGTDYKLNKHNSLGLSYRYKDKSDSDDAKGHLITLKYSYDF